HSREGGNPVLAVCSSFQRKLESSSCFSSFQEQSFHSPCGRAGHFLCLCKESNQRNTPRAPRPTGILPSGFARGLRGFSNAHPCTCEKLARIVRAPAAQLSYVREPRRTGPRVKRRAPARRSVRYCTNNAQTSVRSIRGERRRVAS